VKIFADVLVKHAQSLGGRDIVQSGMETAFRGLADALIVTGTQTGLEADPLELEKLQNVLPDVPVFVGSGITPQNVARFRRADGFIAGTSLKVDGVTTNQVDIVRVKKLECAISSMRP
jgi:membrane complex biogenesis BtpA family protein